VGRDRRYRHFGVVRTAVGSVSGVVAVNVDVDVRVVTPDNAGTLLLVADATVL
jgi:hypothetical protein